MSDDNISKKIKPIKIENDNNQFSKSNPKPVKKTKSKSSYGS